MASFQGNRFCGPMFNQNFPRNNFNTNPMGNRFGMPPFQRPPNPAFRPYQPPERFMARNFQNRPHFSNFPEPAGPSGFRSRLPPNNQVFPMNPAHNFPRPRGSFERPFGPWNQMPPRMGARPQIQNRPRAPMPPHHMGDLPLQPNKKGKVKIREFRKLKDDTTVKPFSCDTCDRAFVNENDLNDHISQHIKCDHVNCTFQAHPKIVALHKKMQHDTGYADKISKLKDDAEIQKWKEERRRRFPTAENVRKRKAEQAEKEARGEVLETKEFGKFKRKRENNGNPVNKDFRKRRGRSSRKSTDRRRQFHPRSQPFKISVDLDSDSDSDSHISLHRFLGMSLTNSAKVITGKSEDVEFSSSPHSGITPMSDKHQLPSESWYRQNLPKIKFDNSISQQNLLYADSNSSNLDKNQTFVLNDDNMNDFINESICEIAVDKSISDKQRNVELLEIADSDDEGPVAIPIVKSMENFLVGDQDVKQEINDSPEILHPSGITPTNASNISNSENGFTRNGDKFNQHSRNCSHVNDRVNGEDVIQGVRKSSLLEKLLADDIRHERNVILQCIRHIVKNNFFRIESKCLK